MLHSNPVCRPWSDSPMSAIHHGRCFGLGLLCCVALALLASPVRGQPRVDIVTAPANAPAVRQLEAIRESLQARDWETAVRAMQKLLDLPEDRLIMVKERQGDKTASRVVSVRTEVLRLLAALPEDGKRFYAGAFGPEAATLLKKALQHADTDMLYYLYQRVSADAGGRAGAGGACPPGGKQRSLPASGRGPAVAAAASRHGGLDTQDAVPGGTSLHPHRRPGPCRQCGQGS